MDKEMCTRNVCQTGKSLGTLFLILLAVPASTNVTIAAIITTNATVNQTIKNMESTTSDPRVHDCRLTAQRIATGLGSVILVETLFCCFVLYQWIKNHRRPKNKKVIPNAYDDQVAAATSIGVSSKQEASRTKHKPINDACYHVLEEPDSPLPQGPQDSLYYCSEDCVDTTSTVKSNKAKHAQDVCYHVLEEPVSPLPQGAQDSLYYCSEGCVDGAMKFTPMSAKNDAFYHVLEEGESPPPQGAQEHGSLYYCSEDCVDKPTQGSPQSKFQLPIISKKKTPDNKTPAIKPQKPLPYNPVLSNQSKFKTKNKASNQTGKPLKYKTGLKDNVIQEMMTRAAHKNTGN